MGLFEVLHPHPKKEEIQSSAELGRRLVSAAESAASQKHPERNEDGLIQQPDLGLFGVFDGAGGHEAGEKAGQLAAEFFSRRLGDVVRHPTSGNIAAKGWLNLLRETFIGASGKLECLRLKYDTERRPDTTATVAKITREGDDMFLAYASVGDSRLYLRRAEGPSFEQLTQDDDYASRYYYRLPQAEQDEIHALLARVETENDLDRMLPCGERLRFFFENRNILMRALSSFSPAPEDFQGGIIQLKKGDFVLLITDGIHDNLTGNEIAVAIGQSENPEEISKALVAAARSRAAGGKGKHIRAKMDDMSAVVVRVEE